MTRGSPADLYGGAPGREPLGGWSVVAGWEVVAGRSVRGGLEPVRLVVNVECDAGERIGVLAGVVGAEEQLT